MKKSEIFLVIGCFAAILISGYFIYTMYFAKPAANTAQNQISQQTTSDKITGNVDDGVMQKINSFTDYGEAQLDNIGRVNPFGPLN